MAAYGFQYAGDCATANQREDIGKQCTSLYEDRGTTHIYAASEAGSEIGAWLLLQQGPDGWSVVDAASAGDGSTSLIPPPW